MKKFSGRRFFDFLISGILLLSSGVSLASCSRGAKAESTSFTAMNTYMTVKSYGKTAKEAAAANALVQQEVERLEGILSTTIEGSDVYKINNSDKEEIPVNAETAYLIRRGTEFYKSPLFVNGALRLVNIKCRQMSESMNSCKTQTSPRWLSTRKAGVSKPPQTVPPSPALPACS